MPKLENREKIARLAASSHNLRRQNQPADLMKYTPKTISGQTLVSAGVIGFIGIVVMVIAIAAGAIFYSGNLPQDQLVTPDGVAIPVPGSDANWVDPTLGKDPDVYRLPFRNNNQCDGPDCN